MAARPETTREFSDKHFNLATFDVGMAGIPLFILVMGYRIFGQLSAMEHSSLLPPIATNEIIWGALSYLRIQQSTNPDKFQKIDELENQGMNFIRESTRGAVLQFKQLFRLH